MRPSELAHPILRERNRIAAEIDDVAFDLRLLPHDHDDAADRSARCWRATVGDACAINPVLRCFGDDTE